MDQAKFKEIYDNNLWLSSESKSGTGSTLVATKEIRDGLYDIFLNYEIDTLLDYGCGDFNWMKEFAVILHKYVGMEIVDELVADNREKYKDYNNVVFSNSTPELFDMYLAQPFHSILVRDVLVHFSDQHVTEFLEKISKSNIKYMFATNFLGKGHNNDIQTGWWRDMCLMNPPFNLVNPIETIVCYSEPFVINEAQGTRYDKTLSMWEIKTMFK